MWRRPKGVSNVYRSHTTELNKTQACLTGMVSNQPMLPQELVSCIYDKQKYTNVREFKKTKQQKKTLTQPQSKAF